MIRTYDEKDVAPTDVEVGKRKVHEAAALDDSEDGDQYDSFDET